MKTVIKVLDVNEAALILCFTVDLIASGANNIYLKMSTSLDFSFLLFRG